jgi:hypothetical protein
MDSKDHFDSKVEFNSLRTYFNNEMTKNSNDLKSKIDFILETN